MLLVFLATTHSIARSISFISLWELVIGIIAIYQGIVPRPMMTIVWPDGREFLKSSSYYL